MTRRSASIALALLLAAFVLTPACGKYGRPVRIKKQTEVPQAVQPAEPALPETTDPAADKDEESEPKTQP